MRAEPGNYRRCGLDRWTEQVRSVQEDQHENSTVALKYMQREMKKIGIEIEVIQ